MMTRAEVEEVTLRVYRRRLNDACTGDADRMVAKDGDDGQKQRKRSEGYLPTVKAVLIEVGLYREERRGAKK